ncbi:hypothetical protein ACLE0P_000127 [Cronobacter sakazakii]|uniref:hypothetical protein n=1 Tax=Cronobacter sakazakii TaxID=28141 RepID=UPI000CFB7E05|nr:hypothetical protein [Cronobacter sakazakii]EKM1384708.1 hypothetical protein [Cronobacter sakazakii]EKM6429630.1 hypothetical protein [Cronobacter sakazakii]ELY2627311.1 hypothetical protein [Cronobacter sakazakii]ELY4257880.1 hypothetical protein [Cronobacter sakazakii]ELY4665439.1 hypothetical protein [Cronobacter sakazakii]
MLPENYPSRSDAEKRLLAVNAALELIKASVAAPNGYEGRDKLAKDIEYTRHHLAELADTIQAALESR